MTYFVDRRNQLIVYFGLFLVLITLGIIFKLTLNNGVILKVAIVYTWFEATRKLLFNPLLIKLKLAKQNLKLQSDNLVSNRLFNPLTFPFIVNNYNQPVYYLSIVGGLNLIANSFLPQSVITSFTNFTLTVLAAFGSFIYSIYIIFSVFKAQQTQQTVKNTEKKRKILSQFELFVRDFRSIKHYKNFIVDKSSKSEKYVKKEITLLYKNLKLKPPKHIIWCDSPRYMEKLMLEQIVYADYITANFCTIGRREKPYPAELVERIFATNNINYLPQFTTDEDSNNIIIAKIRQELNRGFVSFLRNNKQTDILMSDDFDSLINGIIFSDSTVFYVYKYCTEALNEAPLPVIEPLYRLTRSCYALIPGKDLIVLCRQPIELHLNDAGELHHEQQAALAFADGYEIYAIDGVEVPEKVILEPQNQTIEEIRTEENIEAKRIRIERYGWMNYLEKIQATVIHSTGVSCSEEISWLEALYYAPIDEIKVLVTYDPSTGRVYALEVPINCNTCEEAQAYLLSKDNIMDGLDFELQINNYPRLRT